MTKMCYKKLKDLMHRLPTKEYWLQPPQPSVGCLFWIMYYFGFASFLGSFGLNIKAMVNYAISAEWWLFSILLMAVVLPQVPINLFSFWWFRNDSADRLVSWRLTIAHFLLLALPVRMVRMRRQANGTKTGEASQYHRFYLAQADLSFLRLVGVYAGSGSQLVLRIYKLLKNSNDPGDVVLEMVFAVLAAVSLAMSTISLCRHCRSHRYDKKELSQASTILQVLYRVCFLASRVVALACLFYLGITIGVTICSVFFVCFLIWFHCMETDFTENVGQERFYHVLLAYLHIFGMFNVKDNPAKYRYAFYYTLSFFVEVLVIVAFMRSVDGMYWLSVFPCVFLIGLMCHYSEHHYFHPGGILYIEREKEAWENHCEECAEERESAKIEASRTAAVA